MQASSSAKGEYIINVPDDRLGSIGGFVPAAYLEQSPDKKGWKVKTEACRTMYQNIVRIMVDDKLIADETKAPKMSPECVFQDQRTVAEGTGFLVHQDMIIASAGHVVFKRPPQPPPQPSDPPKPPLPYALRTDIDDLKFVFGLTEKYCKGDGTLIPAANVWGIDRVLFGQIEDFKDVEKDGIFSLDDDDRQDWALVRLKALEGSQAPAPKNVAKLYTGAPPPEGPCDILAVGHTWSTSLKLSRSPEDASSRLRTGVKANEQITPEQLQAMLKAGREIPKGRWKTGLGRPPRDYTFVNIYKHNIRVAPGNSGGPVVLYKSKPEDGLTVLGIQSTVVGNTLERNLLYQPHSKSPIEPYFRDENAYGAYSSITKNDIWSSLITTRAQLLVVVRVGDESLGAIAANNARLSIRLDFAGQNGPRAPLTLGPAEGNLKSIRFDLTLPEGYLPCELRSLTVTYVAPPGSEQQKRVFLEALNVISRKPNDDDIVNWTPLLLSGSFTRMTQPSNDQVTIPVTVDTMPYIPRQWTQDLVRGPEALSLAVPATLH